MNRRLETTCSRVRDGCAFTVQAAAKTASSKSTLAILASWLLLTACAHMHHYQLGEIDSTRGRLTPFEIQVDETGLDVHEGAAIVKGVVQSREMARRIGAIETIIALTQVGPKTGNPTFSDDWADGMLAKVLEQCPSGQVTGLVAVRETMKYPVVSGEIVAVKGYCIQ
jgi:hypothetical protein